MDINDILGDGLTPEERAECNKQLEEECRGLTEEQIDALIAQKEEENKVRYMQIRQLKAESMESRVYIKLLEHEIFVREHLFDLRANEEAGHRRAKEIVAYLREHLV